MYEMKKDKIVYIEDEKELGILSFSINEDIYTIHTIHVDDSLRGKGIASQLMEEFIGHLEQAHKTCIAECSYAISWLEQHPEYVRYVHKK